MKEHVLNWEKIINGSRGDRTGSDKNDSRYINKGLLFEDLIEKLIAAMFPNEIWRRTAESNDGKRDFVYPYEENLPDKKWAECKNYSNTLSLNVIAPTLIMGALEEIQCIIFFSYSPLNENALDGLLRYSENQHKTIKVFDGIVLDSLICKYHAINGIEEFFPDANFDEAFKEINRKPLRIVKTIRDINGNKLSYRHSFELGERFYIRTILQHCSNEELKVQAHFHNSNKALLRDISQKNVYSLNYAEIKEYSVLCEALCPGKVSASVRFFDANNGETIAEAETKITILDEPYLPWSGESALQARDCCIDHLTGYNNEPLLISGGSGTGKTTLLDIISQEESIRERFRILWVDLNLTRSVCMRNVFSQIFGMKGSDETPEEQEAEASRLTLLVSGYAESAEMLARTLADYYDWNQPYLFLVDDIQKISRPYITFFQEMDHCAKEKGFSIYYLFALNEDKETPADLFARLNWDENYQNRPCRTVSLAKFGKKDILTYLKTRYGLENINDVLDGMERTITPLELHRLCAVLRKERIIIQTPDSKVFQIVDRFEFSNRIRQVVYETVPFQHICDSLDNGGISEYLLKYLYVSGEISDSLQRHTALLDGLVAQRLIKENSGKYEFYHDAIRDSMGKALDFTVEDYADIFADTTTDSLSKAICALNCPGQIRGGDGFLNEFFSARDTIDSAPRRYEFCKLVFDRLSALSKMGLTASALAYVRSNYNYLNEECGHDMFFQFLQHVVDTALTAFWDTDEESVGNMAFFIKKYFDRALSSYNYSKSLQYYEKIDEMFQKVQNISEDQRFFWRAHYANRAAIACDRNSIPLADEPHDATELYQHSQNYCIMAGSPDELVVQTLVDDFNRHYIYRHDLSSGIVEGIYACLQTIDKENLSEPLVLEYHLLLLEFLRDNRCESSVLSNLLDRVRTAYESNKAAFYTLKLYILEIDILTALKRYKEAGNLIPRVEEFAYKRDMRSYMYRITYIKANLMILQNDSFVSDDAYRLSVLAFEQMIDAGKDNANRLKREVFLLKRLISVIGSRNPQWLKQRINSCYPGENRKLLQSLSDCVGNLAGKQDDFLTMESYLVFEGISFPAV